MVKGEANNSANHIYNIVKNKRYNIWTDPSTGRGTNANIYGWHHTLEDIVQLLDPNWYKNNEIQPSEEEEEDSEKEKKAKKKDKKGKKSKSKSKDKNKKIKDE